MATAMGDDDGAISYARLWQESDGVARKLRSSRRRAGHDRGAAPPQPPRFVVGLVAAAKVGADIVYLNTGFAGPQLADVVAHEGIEILLHDDEYDEAVATPTSASPSTTPRCARSVGSARWCRSCRRGTSGAP